MCNVPAEADGGVEELRPNPRVEAEGALHFVHVGVGGLAQGRDGVHARDPLRQKGVGHQLRHLRGPVGWEGGGCKWVQL